MSIPLVVNNQTFNFPENRESPSWGENVSAWASQVTTVLGNVANTGDILQTSAIITNNTASPAPIVGLLFNGTQVRSAIVQYSVYRTTATNELVQNGLMFITYKTVANTWGLVDIGSGGGGITFSISGGQVNYTSTNMSGITPVGSIHFSAVAKTV